VIGVWFELRFPVIWILLESEVQPTNIWDTFCVLGLSTGGGVEVLPVPEA
jgi:hypothetical protein